MTKSWQKNYPKVPDLTEAELDENSSLKKMLQLVGRNQRVIDFGCATGYFARLLGDRDCQVTGVELNANAAKVAEQYCEQVIVADLDVSSLTDLLPAQSFDVAVFGDVLEHLRNPWKVLEEVRQLLKPEGWVVASIPNVAHGAVRLALLQGNFEYEELGLLDNTHLRFFTRKTVEELFDRSGYFVDVLERTVLPVFSGSTWVPQINKIDFSPETIAAIEQDEEADTFQFVLRAFPLSLEGKLAALDQKHSQTLVQQAQLQSQLQQTQQRLQATQDELNQSQTQLHEVQTEAQTQLQASQTQLQETQAQLQASQAQLHEAQIQLHEVQTEAQTQLQTSQAYMQHLQTELGQVQSQLAQAKTDFHDAQTELQQTRSKCEDTSTKLQQVRSRTKHLRSKLDETRSELAAVQSSKFWKLRNQWFKVKRSLGGNQN